MPLLQIETHGDGDSGIGPSDKDGLTWPELMAALTPLNQLTGVRLPVILSACHGIWGIKMAEPMERSPFFALMGPDRKVTPGEVVRGMRQFYRGIFEKKDGTVAMRMLNNIIRMRITRHSASTTSSSCSGMSGTGTSLPHQLRSRSQTYRAGGSAGAKRPRSQAEIDHLRGYMREWILDYHARFEESRRHFFYIDLHPRNDARFNLVLTLTGQNAEIVEN